MTSLQQLQSPSQDAYQIKPVKNSDLVSWHRRNREMLLITMCVEKTPEAILCVYMCSCACTCVLVHVYLGAKARGPCWISFSIFLFLETVSAWLTGQWALGIPGFASTVLGYRSNPRFSWLCGKHLIAWASSPVPKLQVSMYWMIELDFFKQDGVFVAQSMHPQQRCSPNPKGGLTSLWLAT